jgi:cobalamin biosynthesis protein CobT
MSEQINSGQIEERETPGSGLLLSVEPLQASAQLNASDDNADTGGSGVKDTSDDAGADTDGSDTSGTDTDLTDALGADTDGSDAADTDGSDSDSSDSDGSDSGASIKIDSKDA